MTSNSEISEKLLPCPFCGSASVAQGASRGRISVWCFCGAEGPKVDFPEVCIDPVTPIRECYAAWNRRAALARAEANAGEPVAWECEGERPGEWKEPRHIIYDPELAQQRMESPWWNVRPLVYAHPAPQPSGPVQVKPLEWSSRDCLHLAYSGFGTYRIEDQGSNWKEDRYWLDHNGERIGKCPTLEAAKAAAQADYERRILSALTAGKPEQAVPSGPVEVTPETVHPSHDVRDEDISGIISDPVCQRCRISAYGPQKDRLLKPCRADEHGINPDDEAVDRFALAMKAKLKWEREERGRYGWNDPSVCSEEYLSRLLVEHLAKGNEGNFEDIANFCMMLHQRGAHPRVLAAALATAGKPEQVPSGWREITEEDRPPNDTDVLMGHWETWPYPRWVVECGHYGSTRGGWIHGRVTHWLPLDILPAAPAAPTAGGGDG